ITYAEASDRAPYQPRWRLGRDGLVTVVFPLCAYLAADLADRFGRRTTLSLPLVPPPQKKRSPPSLSRPDTTVSGGISSFSRTSPLAGSTCRSSLWSASQVPCHS